MEEDQTDFQEPIHSQFIAEKIFARNESVTASLTTSEASLLSKDSSGDSSKESEAEKNLEENIPAELLKEYHFGCGPWHPQWLQWLFARKKFFTFLLCCYAFLQGAIVNGKSVDLVVQSISSLLCIQIETTTL